MGKRTLPKKGNNQAPPVSEVLFHLLRLEADWKVEPPPLHPMEREVRKSLKIGKKFMAPLQKVEEKKNKQLYHRWFRFAALQLPAPEQTCVMCNLLNVKVHQYLDLKVAKGISVLPNPFQIGRAQLLSDWATQATKQHGGDSLFH